MRQQLLTLECDSPDSPKDLMDWRKEWVGMPVFEQEEKKPFKELKIRFETEDDYRQFAELIGQKLTERTKSIWFPEFRSQPRGRWVDAA